MMPERADVAGKQFSPIPPKANLYVTRTRALGNTILFPVYLNGKHIDAIAAKTYLLFEVDPGKHKVAVITKESQSALTMNLDKGDNCFIEDVKQA